MIPDDLEKKKHKNLVPTLKKLNETLNKISIDTKVKELRRFGIFDTGGKKSTTVHSTFNMEHEARLVLAENFEKRTELKKNNFLMPMLSGEYAKTENLCLKKRRELIDNDVIVEKLMKRKF